MLAWALDGYFTAVGPVLAFPDTNDIQTDLITRFTAFVRPLRDTRSQRDG